MPPTTAEDDALILASIFAGAASAETVSWEVAGATPADDAVVIEYRGEAEFISADVQALPEGGPLLESEKASETETTHVEFAGVNFASHHQFTIKIPKSVLSQFAPPSLDDEDEDDYGPGDNDEAVHEVDLSEAPRGWSYNFDDRQRRYGVNANVGGVNRWQTQVGAGCSGALVGPRHVVTAAHCLFDFSSGAFYDDYNVRAGANGTAERAEVYIDDDAPLPPGEFLWAFVPPDYMSTGQRQYDFGVLVTPESIGGSGTGQAGCYGGQCWFGYVTYSKANMKSKSYYRRGYPFCSYPGRIDEPCQTGTWASYQSCSATPCNPNHLYGQDSSCQVGGFESKDSSGYHRLFHHACDASAGDSGSPLYHYNSSLADWVVVSVQSSQECGASSLCSPSLPATTLARPLIDVRITPEYRGYITYFRNVFP